jgi:hypothetical protein
MMVLIQSTHLTLQVISILVLHLATGGDTIDFSGYYFIHTFTSSGTFTPSQAFYADYLVVAGGGGGGGYPYGGGGGAGGGSTVTATGGFRVRFRNFTFIFNCSSLHSYSWRWWCGWWTSSTSGTTGDKWSV